MEKAFVGTVRSTSGNVFSVELWELTPEDAAKHMRIFGDIVTGPVPKETANPATLPALGGVHPVGSWIDEEYRELHAFYVRCAEVREQLMEIDPDALRSPLAGELLGHYAALGNEAARVLIFLQTRLKAEAPALWAAWRVASRVSNGHA